MTMKTLIIPAAVLLASMSPLRAGQIANLSTRARVETGDAAVITEFVVQGSAPKKVLMRGLGPSMSSPGALADPTMALYRADGTLIIKNNDWQQAPNAQAIQDTGLAPSDPKESAILRTLSPGTYTTILRGVNDTTGTGLSEIYDLDSSSSVLTAVGTRAQVEGGDGALIAGFILTGDTSKDVLVRVLGKSIGVAGALQDPKLELHDGNGNVIANDNWKSTQQARIQNTGLAPSDAHEAAIVATLQPGAYTVVASGVNGTTGIAFVQAYALPYNGNPLDPTPGPPPPPIRFETENLEVTAHSATHTIFQDAHLSGGKGTLLSNTSPGSFVTYSVPVPSAGKYEVKVKIRTGAKRGIFQLSIGGTDQGSPQDEYSANVNYPERDLGSISFAAAGTQQFKFTVTGKNANSGGSAIDFDAIDLVPQ